MTSLLLLKSMLMANAVAKSKKKKKKSVIKPKPIKKLRKCLNTCRICSEEEGDIPIFNNFVHPNLSEDIHHFSGVRMVNSGGLSQHMCQSCLDLLNGCIMFREMCQKSNEKMIKIAIKKETNVEPAGGYDQYPECNETDKQADSDSSFNIPSPNFSGDCTEVRDSTCDKEFSELPIFTSNKPLILKDETNINPLVKRFLCDVCGKTAKSNANLQMHKLTHQNVFPFKCDSCPYQGRTMDLLKVHKRSHLTQAERPYKCPHCPKATTSTSNLSKHIRHVHSANKAYKCTYCERAFSFPHDMKRHVKEIHLRQDTAECDICFKKFNTKKILREHLYKIHKLRGAKQGRLPAYLQAQMDQPCSKSISNVT